MACDLRIGYTNSVQEVCSGLDNRATEVSPQKGTLAFTALGAPYELHVFNMKAAEQRPSAYLAINPLGNVPAIQHGEAPTPWPLSIKVSLIA